MLHNGYAEPGDPCFAFLVLFDIVVLSILQWSINGCRCCSCVDVLRLVCDDGTPYVT